MSIEPFDLERFSLHYHKCPHPKKGKMPPVDIFNQYSIDLKAFTLLQSEMKDPVGNSQKSARIFFHFSPPVEQCV